MRRWGLASALLVCALAGGCSTAPRVLLLDDDGRPGAIAILNQDGAEQGVIDEPYTEARLAPASFATRTVDPDALPARYRALLEALPPPAMSFTLYFNQGTGELVPESQTIMAVIAAEIAARTAPQIEIVGHTDTQGDEAANMALSMQRAEAVIQLIAALGAPREDIFAVGRGELDPLIPTPDEVFEPRNSRVEVIIR